MSEAHDNTVPCRTGSYVLGPRGIICYLPIQEQALLRPFLALIICQREDGQIVSMIDEIWRPLQGLDEEEK
jgi:hypothetical protein